jgi:electron-transferring-flavoprotein dehydrogenase
MNPRAIRRLFAGRIPIEQMPTYGPVHGEAVYLLTRSRALRIPPPPTMMNHGNWIVSVSELGRFLAEQAESAGAMILPETTGQTLLVEHGRVVGVRTGDKGRGREGEPLSNFEPGVDVTARVTVLAEGTAGHLTTAAIDRFGLEGRNPQVWALGVKEVWKVARPLHRIVHTMGWPLRKRAKYGEFGGSFVYPMGEEHVSIGFVVGLEYADVELSAHDLLQEFKTHRLVQEILAGGERVAWGAKTIPSGGYWSMPSRLSVPGMVIAGDAAGMVNIPELKGIHYAMHAGMYAAEAIVDALKRESINFEAYDEKIRDSVIEEDMYRSRNMRQPFEHGFFAGGVLASLMTITRGAFPGGHWRNEPDAAHAMSIDTAAKDYPNPDNKYIFDKLSSVFASGNATRDDAPNHIRLQTRVPREIAQTWVSMCPAQVYEIPDDQRESGAETIDLQVTPSNCVQCGAITAKGGRLTLPEGGDGPLYQET